MESRYKFFLPSVGDYKCNRDFIKNPDNLQNESNELNSNEHVDKEVSQILLISLPKDMKHFIILR